RCGPAEEAGRILELVCGLGPSWIGLETRCPGAIGCEMRWDLPGAIGCEGRLDSPKAIGCEARWLELGRLRDGRWVSGTPLPTRVGLSGIGNGSSSSSKSWPGRGERGRWREFGEGGICPLGRPPGFCG